MRVLNPTIKIFIFLPNLLTAFSWAAEIDQRALEQEHNKQLVPLDSAKIEQQYRIDQQALDDFHYAYNNQDEFDSSEYAFDNNEPKPSADKAVEDAETQIQIYIYKRILAFERENISYGHEIKKLRRDYIRESKNKDDEFLPSDIAKLIGNFLATKDEYNLAIKFYMISANSHRSFGEEHLSAGNILVRYFNSQIALNKPKAPTSELFAAVRKAIWHYRCGSSACEIGDYFVDSLTQVRDMMVRWPVSPAKLLKDDFYAPYYLVKKIYDINFINMLLDDVKKLDAIFNSKRFLINNNNNNLLNALKDAGFKGVCKSLGDNCQYIWVNPKGYIIRIKYDTGKNSGKASGEWQFTIALSYVNPFKWDGERAVGIKKSRDLDRSENTLYVSNSSKYDDLSTYEYNEIFKIVKDRNLVMLAPAFRNYYWHLDRDELNEVMRKAHYKLFAVEKSEKIEEHCHLNHYGNPINRALRRAPQERNFIVGGTPCKKQNLPKR
jgi:hypothetical protein